MLLKLKALGSVWRSAHKWSDMWCLMWLGNHTSFISLQSFSLTSCSFLVISFWEWLCKSVNSNRGSCCHFLGFPHRFRNCVSLRVFISVHCFITFSVMSRGCGPVQLQCSVSSCCFKMVWIWMGPDLTTNYLTRPWWRQNMLNTR